MNPYKRGLIDEFELPEDPNHREIAEYFLKDIEERGWWLLPVWAVETYARCLEKEVEEVAEAIKGIRLRSGNRAFALVEGYRGTAIVPIGNCLNVLLRYKKTLKL